MRRTAPQDTGQQTASCDSDRTSQSPMLHWRLLSEAVMYGLEERLARLLEPQTSSGSNEKMLLSPTHTTPGKWPGASVGSATRFPPRDPTQQL